MPLKDDWANGNSFTHTDQNDVAEAVNTLSGGVVNLDDFAGADDDAKLTAALTYAAAQTYRPAIRLPAREVTFNTSAREPYNGMRIIGPSGADGPKNLEVEPDLLNHRVFLNVGNGTSAWFSGVDTYYSIYFGDIAFQEGNSTAQFWHQPVSTGQGLWSCQFHGLTFLGFKHIFGTPAAAAAVTGTVFSGYWQVQAFRDTAFTMTGSDCAFWLDATANVGSNQTAPSPGTPQVILNMSKSRFGALYQTVLTGWAGTQLVGGEGTAFFSPVMEGANTGTPADEPVLLVDDGNYTLYAPNLNFVDDATADGVIEQTGGNLTLVQPRYNRASAASATFPLLYQTGGTAQIVNAIALASGEFPYARWSDTTTTKMLNSNKVLNAPGGVLVGTQDSVGTTTQPALSLGGTYGTAGAGQSSNLKLKVYDDGGTPIGLGMQAGAFEYQAGSGNDHVFYVGSATEALRIASSGAVTAASNPVGVKVSVPGTATSTGVVGQWAADSSFFYVCTATNTWRRVAIASW